MARVCAVTGKKVLFGNNVSHANNKTKRCFRPNINKHRFYSEVENRWITLRVSKKGLRIIDKEGFDEVWQKIKNKVCSRNGKTKD